MHKNLAITGPLRSGKDSVANYLVTNYGYSKASFASSLKDEVVKLLNAADGGKWSRERLDEQKTRLRPLLQFWGTEFRRAQDPDYWVKRIRLLGGPIVVTDARFFNELAFLENQKFIIIRIEMADEMLYKHLRDNSGMTDAQIGATLNHPSEQEWKSYPVNHKVLSVVDKTGEGLASLIQDVTNLVI